MKVAGNLKIISQEETSRTVKYLCECSCGNNIELTQGQLNKVKVRSCGCMPNGVLDRRGMTFGNLTVLEYHGNKNESHLWECRCDCGNETIAKTCDLTSGHKKSCGCLKKLPEGQAALNAHFRTYKKGATTRGLEFSLNKVEFKDIVTQDCHYCGENPTYTESKEILACNGNIKVNGIDRIDNSQGYTADNTLPCCSSCNFLKGTLGYEEFTNLCKKISKNLNSGS